MQANRDHQALNLARDVVATILPVDGNVAVPVVPADSKWCSVWMKLFFQHMSARSASCSRCRRNLTAFCRFNRNALSSSSRRYSRNVPASSPP